MKTALLCSYEKDEALLRLGSALYEKKWDLLGSAGTAKFLNENAIPCRDVSEIVGEPILGHRVVTLAREIYAGLLSRDEDQAELERMNVPRIDLVYVTLYPLEKTIADPASTPQDVIEKTDIGGPTLLRAAAKGRRIVLSDPAQIELVGPMLASESVDEQTIERLAAAAERRVANYVDVSASYLEHRTV
jgi:phosphoribosylaminoimidazolecarboxamide formyltransferase/IMP cyclohydrolase